MTFINSKLQVFDKMFVGGKGLECLPNVAGIFTSKVQERYFN